MSIKGRLVCIQYRKGTPVIDMWIRTEDGRKVKVTVNDFKPYFYVPDPEGYFIGIDGERLRRIEAREPGQVEELRSKFQKHYEANIGYVQRFLIDVGVHDGIEVPHEGIISWEQVRPCKTNIKPRVVFFDIEVANPGERITDDYIRSALHPLICYTLYYDGKYFTGVYRKDLENKYEQRDKDWFILYHNNERDLLQYLIRLIKTIQPDVFIVWNERFDLPYLIHRCERVGIRFDYEGFECFDAMYAYMMVKSRDEFISLKEAAIEEGIITQEEKEEFNYDWWFSDLERLIYYNKRDVWITFEINNKYRLFERFDAKKVLAGLASYKLVYDQKPAIDVAHLRVAKRKNVILPTYAPPKIDKFEGAYVHQPKPGLYDNVAVFDFSRYYPSIILSFKLDPAILHAYYREHEKFDLPTYLKFADEHVRRGGLTLTLDVVREFLKMRDQIDAEIEKAQPGTPEYERLQDLKQAVKGLINAIYGVMGHDGFRLFAVELASSITKLAKEGILAIMKKVTEMGYTFIYGDSVHGSTRVPIWINGELRYTEVEKLYEELRELDNVVGIEYHGKEVLDLTPVNVLTLATDERGSVKICKVRKIIRHKVNKRLFRVKTNGGKEVIVTEDHSLVVWKGNKLVEEKPQKSVGLQVNTIDFEKLLTCKDLECFWDKLAEFTSTERIVSVEEVKSSDSLYVYDLEVDGCHTFLANGIFVHNTDSCMVQCSPEEAPQLAKQLTEFVNNYFYQKYGVKTDVKLKYEKYFKTVFFTDAKKKYAYWVTWEGKSCDYIGFKGYEVVRSDYSKFIKKMMREVLELVLRKKFKELEELIPKKVREFRKAPLSEIAIPKGIDKPSFDAYDKLPHHVRGAIYANTFFGEQITPGMKVYYIYVKDVKGKPHTSVVAFSDPEKFDQYRDLFVVDWKRMIKFSIEDRVKKIFHYLGLNLKLDSQQTTLW